MLLHTVMDGKTYLPHKGCLCIHKFVESKVAILEILSKGIHNIERWLASTPHPVEAHATLDTSKDLPAS